MKRKILLIGIFVFLMLSRTFAGQYVYFEASKQKGVFSAYARVYYPKGSVDNTTGNKSVNDYVEDILASLQETYNVTGYVFSANNTIVHVKNNMYIISFTWDPTYRGGGISVTRFNTNNLASEKIYDTGAQEYWSYNYLYQLYQEQCNKYLNML